MEIQYLHIWWQYTILIYRLTNKNGWSRQMHCTASHKTCMLQPLNLCIRACWPWLWVHLKHQICEPHTIGTPRFRQVLLSIKENSNDVPWTAELEFSWMKLFFQKSTRPGLDLKPRTASTVQIYRYTTGLCYISSIWTNIIHVHVNL